MTTTLDQTLLNQVSTALPDITRHQITTTLTLLNDGNTVPFVARYRKEMTGSLDEVQIRAVQDTWTHVEKLANRKHDVLTTIDAQNALTPALKEQINHATTLQAVEDLYLPYKQKRRTKATIAKEHGLMPFAKWLLTFPTTDSRSEAAAYVDAAQELPDVDAVITGAHEILAEAFSEEASFREFIRDYTRQHATLATSVKTKGKALDEDGVYQQYYDFEQPLAKLATYQTLAINRGEKAGVLKVTIAVDPAAILNFLRFRIVGHHQGSAVTIITAAYEDTYKRFIGPAIERELRGDLTDDANTHAIGVFGTNLYHLLMQAPMKGRVVLGFDPAYRTGCKLAVIDANGKFLTKLVIYPHKPASNDKRQAAAGQLHDLIETYQVEMIAIGNGTASRESEVFVAEVLRGIDRNVQYVIVNEAGASVYSASQAARDEFPDLHVEERSAISIGRRLQDPLAELVKIDPQSVGVGQYQHDVPTKELTHQLDNVVETAVNQVGVNLNTASSELLAHISGLNKTIANNVVTYRNENGRYTDRRQLKKVARLGPKAYEQAVGFLRIIGGKNPLDNTDIHPESYPVAKQILDLTATDTSQLGAPALATTLAALNHDQLAQQTGAGVATVTDILTSLAKPGRDLRDDMPAPLLRHDVLTLADLKPGMELQGTVRNVVDFGAFVDVGVKHDGLVHVSKLTKRFVKDPAAVVAVGDIVTVWVDDVDEVRQRIQLTMLDPNEA
ncbi:Tex family protein [Furfurilactobacillus entadae]|uniref:Tex family protein n=1 Tax=Furfurilactobacillus entadae TaxID=2922307 RepID=UPI0035EE2D30